MGDAVFVNHGKVSSSRFDRYLKTIKVATPKLCSCGEVNNPDHAHSMAGSPCHQQRDRLIYIRRGEEKVGKRDVPDLLASSDIDELHRRDIQPVFVIRKESSTVSGSKDEYVRLP